MWIVQMFLWWVIDQFAGAIASYTIEKAGHWVLATLVSLQIFTGVSDPQNTIVTSFPITGAIPCHPDEVTGNYYLDLGMQYVNENCGFLDQGWYDVQRAEHSFLAPYGDISRLRLPNPNSDEGLGSTATIVLHDIDPSLEYTLAVAVLKGDYDDSFAVSIPGIETPLFGVDSQSGVAYNGGGKVNRGVNLFSVSIKKEITAASPDLTIIFKNTSEDKFSHTAFYYLWMGPTISKEVALSHASPEEAICLSDNPEPQRFDLGDPNISIRTTGWQGTGTGKSDDKYNDTTILVQASNTDNHVYLPSCAFSDYTLTVASRNGSCDQSFGIYIHGEELEPVAHDSTQEPMKPLVQQFKVPKDLVDSGEMDVNFKNTSDEGCDRAAVWYVELARIP